MLSQLLNSPSLCFSKKYSNFKIYQQFLQWEMHESRAIYMSKIYSNVTAPLPGRVGNPSGGAALPAGLRSRAASLPDGRSGSPRSRPFGWQPGLLDQKVTLPSLPSLRLSLREEPSGSSSQRDAPDQQRDGGQHPNATEVLQSHREAAPYKVAIPLRGTAQLIGMLPLRCSPRSNSDFSSLSYGQFWFQKLEKSNQNTAFFQRPIAHPLQWIQKGDLLGDCTASAKGELALGRNLLVAYMPWEGFNFEDAVLINHKVLSKYTSLHIEKYDFEIKGQIKRNIPEIPLKELQNLDKNGIVKIGSWVQEGDILVGQIIPIISPNQTLLTHEKLLYDIVGQKSAKSQEKCLRANVSGRVIRISYFTSEKKSAARGSFPKGLTAEELHHGVGGQPGQPWGWSAAELPTLRWSAAPPSQPSLRSRGAEETAHQRLTSRNSLKKMTIYIANKREFQVGDKISGRHGNKGIISQIFSDYDMPYLFNGSTIDVLLNPLGVPSRMNVGQILECLLGFAGQIFYTKFQVLCFDEMYGYEASRSFIYSKLFESCKKTRQKWLFSKKTPGKLHLFDGRNGQLFHQSIIVGSSYLMKLIHIVDEKIHARATGPYSLITQQPLRGRAKHGGQRFGEMEVWALQGFGSAYTLQELLTVKSDDLQGRNQIMQTLLKNTPLRFGTSESLRVVLRELQCLCLDLQIY